MLNVFICVAVYNYRVVRKWHILEEAFTVGIMEAFFMEYNVLTSAKAVAQSAEFLSVSLSL